MVTFTSTSHYRMMLLYAINDFIEAEIFVNNYVYQTAHITFCTYNKEHMQNDKIGIFGIVAYLHDVNLIKDKQIIVQFNSKNRNNRINSVISRNNF